ncbi:MAG: peptide-methionine (S)-S-oxide reductase MsrA [Candidatus Eremiobacteraeota bacterium]|nr:peptide-methionine (S)-S-oxide reductase MsrA [Candidatus Eremiobacteraeota bacterium]MBC5822484.1 peptide-methionine (S)-S-oxide reductase MsrA [Candidatus Eremiobacteraeota bacterium]
MLLTLRRLLRYAVLSTVMAALVGGSLAAAPAKTASPPSRAVAVLAGGCFWGMEDVFEKLRGVTNVEAGYSGGSRATAHYESVSTGTTGHAESVRITFDPRLISYRTLLDVYFRVAHDPTELNRQGPDAGTQYRSVIFYANQAQRRDARAEIARLSKSKAYGAPIVTQVDALAAFYPAEDYHQHFADRNPVDPYIVTIDDPKVVALRGRFPQLLKR